MKKLLLSIGLLVIPALLFGQGIQRNSTKLFVSFGTSSVLASATTIAPTSRIHHISGAVLITTITVPAGCSPTCQITLIPDGAFTTDASVNISLASTGVVNKALLMTYDGTKWNPSY